MLIILKKQIKLGDKEKSKIHKRKKSKKAKAIKSDIHNSLTEESKGIK